MNFSRVLVAGMLAFGTGAYGVTLGYWHEWDRFAFGASAFLTLGFVATGAWYLLPGPIAPYVGGGLGLIGEVDLEFRRDWSSGRVQLAAQIVEPLFSVNTNYVTPQPSKTLTLLLFTLRVLL